jgi:hypothetical protein
MGQRKRGQGVFLTAWECVDLIRPAEDLLDEAKRGQQYADRHGLQEDHGVDEFQALVDKLREGAGRN